jgi:hypothetical protein
MSQRQPKHPQWTYTLSENTEHSEGGREKTLNHFARYMEEILSRFNPSIMIDKVQETVAIKLPTFVAKPAQSLEIIPDATFNDTIIYIPSWFRPDGYTLRPGEEPKGSTIVFDENNVYRVSKASHTDNLAGIENLSITNRTGTHKVGVQLNGGARSECSELPGLLDWKGSNIVRRSHKVGISERRLACTVPTISASAPSLQSKRPPARSSAADNPMPKRNRILLPES